MSAEPTPPSLDFDPMAPADWLDPYPTYRRLRDEAQVHYSESSKTYTISRIDDVVSVLRRPEVFSSQSAFDILFTRATSHLGLRDIPTFLRFMLKTRISPSFLIKGPRDSLITLDPPRHDALRGIVNRGFTPRRVEAWEARISSIVDECMGKLHRGEPFDVVRDLAIPVPVLVITEILGIEPERREEFKDWSNKMIAGISSNDPRSARRPFLEAIADLSRYVHRIVSLRRKDPRDDLISLLVDPRHGETLDEASVMQFIMLLLVAGNETTTNLIGNTVMALLRNPDQLERAVAEPDLLPGMVEEGLRYDGPVQFIMRRASEDIEMADTVIPKNGRVCVLLGSANRDERHFEDPDRFDIGRDAKGHVGFGFGVHFCLGASLARLEAKRALGALIPELPRLRASEAEFPMVDSVLVRGRERLGLVSAS